MFVLNLALSDLLQGILLLISLSKTLAENKVFLNESDILEEYRFSCQLVIGIFNFFYTQATTATVLIAVDRYVTITYWATHTKIMTRKVVLIIIACCSWCLPVIMFIGGYLNTEPIGIALCYSYHIRSKYWIGGVIIIISFTLVIIYILYFKIILSFWKLKRKRSKIMRENRRIVEDIGFSMAPRKIEFIQLRAGIIPIKQSWKNICDENAFNSCNNVQIISGNSKESKSRKERNSFHDQIHRIGRYIKASKYVIIILIAFTVCWVPWCIMFFTELLQHEGGYFNQEKAESCGEKIKTNSSLSSLSYNRTVINIYRMRSIIGKDDSSYFIYLNEVKGANLNSNYCSIIYDTIHFCVLGLVQHLLGFSSSVNSVLNPLIYAIWYQDFRQVVKDVFRCSRT